MKDRINILTIITYGVILSSISILLNVMQEFNFSQFTVFQNGTKVAKKQNLGGLQKKLLNGTSVP